MESVSYFIGFMETPITVIHIIVAFMMILVVLFQGGSSGGVSATFGGGGNASGVLGASGATSLLGKATYACAFTFMLTSISLCIAQSRQGKTGIDKKVLEYNESQNKGSQNKEGLNLDSQKKDPPKTQGMAAPMEKATTPTTQTSPAVTTTPKASAAPSGE